MDASGTTGPGEAFRLGHRRWLDGLRGVAILAVVAYHFNLLPAGYLGVDLFFVLSGFLITGLLLEEYRQSGTIRLRHFYLRRALRLLPALLMLIGGMLTWAALCKPESLKLLRREAVVVLCFAANLTDRVHRVPMGELGFTWSLAVEEQFYLAWPLALLILLRWKARPPVVLGTIVAGIAAVAVWRLVLYAALPSQADPTFAMGVNKLYMGPDTRGDGLLCGCLLAGLAHWGYLPRTRRGRRQLRTGAAFMLGLLGGWATTFYLHVPLSYCGGFTACALATVIVMACLLTSRLPAVNRVLESAPLVFAGRISYGLFLYHIPICLALGLTHEHLGWLCPLNTALVFAVSVLAAVASYYCVERPVLRLKKWLDSPAPCAAPPAETPPLRQAA